MKKIPTIFERDWGGDRSRVLDKPHPDCAWVFAGEGVPTRKLDGTCCMIRDGKLYKRREVKLKVTTTEAEAMTSGEIIASGLAPAGFEIADMDLGKAIGWVPVGDGPDDKWHREALERYCDQLGGLMPDDIPSCELIGPKVQGGAERDLWEGFGGHLLVGHGNPSLAMYVNEPFARTFDGIKAFLTGKDIEGIVFHGPDGKFGKIKGRDFGLKRGSVS